MSVINIKTGTKMKRFTQITSLIVLMLLTVSVSLTAQELKKSYQETYDVNADTEVRLVNGHWSRSRSAKLVNGVDH